MGNRVVVEAIHEVGLEGDVDGLTLGDGVEMRRRLSRGLLGGVRGVCRSLGWSPLI